MGWAVTGDHFQEMEPQLADCDVARSISNLILRPKKKKKSLVLYFVTCLNFFKNILFAKKSVSFRFFIIIQPFTYFS